MKVIAVSISSLEGIIMVLLAATDTAKSNLVMQRTFKPIVAENTEVLQWIIIQFQLSISNLNWQVQILQLSDLNWLCRNNTLDSSFTQALALPVEDVRNAFLITGLILVLGWDCHTSWKKPKNRVRCAKCKVFLCLKNCFETFHMK